MIPEHWSPVAARVLGAVVNPAQTSLITPPESHSTMKKTIRVATRPAILTLKRLSAGM